MRPQAGFLVEVQRVKHEPEPGGIHVDENRKERVDNVDGLHVAVRRHFFHEKIGFVGIAAELYGSPGLADGKGSDDQIILTCRGDGVSGDLIVEVSSKAGGGVPVVVEESELHR